MKRFAWKTAGTRKVARHSQCTKLGGLMKDYAILKVALMESDVVGGSV